MHPKIVLYLVLSCLGALAMSCKQSCQGSTSQASRDGGSRNAPGASGTSTGLHLNLLDGPSGSTGANGLDPDVYHQYKGVLTRAMSTRLVTTLGGKSLTSDFQTILSDPTHPDQAELLVAYAVDCALHGSAPETFTSGAHGFPVKKGLMRTTDDWRTRGLTQAEQEDVHACLATRLNPGTHVDIWLGGDDVIQQDKPTDFQVQEAFWAAIQVGGDGTQDKTFELHVWPSSALLAQCANASVTTLLSKRVCASAGATCNLKVRSDQADCQAIGDFVRCQRVPGGLPPPKQVVIETRLKCSDWCTMYPECTLPPECADAGVPPCRADAGP